MSATTQLEKEIWEAYFFLREKNTNIPSDTLEFIRDAALEKLKQTEYPDPDWENEKE